MNSQRSSALGDVDDPVNELRDLLAELGELVDRDHQQRWSGVGIAACELEQILRSFLGKYALAALELGVE